MENFIIEKKWNVRELFTEQVKEEMECMIEGIFMISLISYFFYRSIFAFFLLSPLVIKYRKEKKIKLRKRKIEEAEIQFKEFLYYIQSNLQAGYSMENAVKESQKDMEKLYGRKAVINIELDRMVKAMGNGINLERGLMIMGEHLGGEIQEFASIFTLAKKMGGRWNEIIERTTSIISRKIEIKEEISLLIHEKELEHKIMCTVPFGLMFYMEMTSADYFHALYHNIFGILVMTGCLIVYLYAYYLGGKIREI